MTARKAKQPGGRTARPEGEPTVLPFEANDAPENEPAPGPTSAKVRWSKAVSVKKLAAVYDVSPTTMRKILAANTIPNTRLSRQLFRIDIDQLPDGTDLRDFQSGKRWQRPTNSTQLRSA